MSAPEEIDRFARAVEVALGMRIADRPRGLGELIDRRAASYRESPASYLRRVEGEDLEELRVLAAELSVGETYFFRHVEQFNAFGDLLAGLVAARGTVRVLSAGCSSGEEPYTLAMVVRERLPDPRAVAIHAIDVNPAALARAREGRYRRWPLRATAPEHEQRWFAAIGPDLVIAPAIREAVTFAEVNLLDERAFAALPAFDVVFCRNVLMYFADPTIRGAVERLVRTLAPGGYLFLGHAETLRDRAHGLELCHTHGTFYYRRAGRASSPVVLTAATPALRAPRDDGWVGDIAAATERVRAMVDGALAAPRMGAAEPVDFAAIRALICDERFADAQAALARLPAAEAAGADAQLLHAIVFAQTGDVAACRRIAEPLLARGLHRASAHYLLAICERDSAAAEPHAQAALAADPTFAMAGVQLAFLARRRGERAASAEAFERAIALLEREEPARLTLFAGGFGRTAVIELCRSELAAARAR